MEYQDYYDEALLEPLEWVRMDTDMLRDFKVRRLMGIGGFAYLGMYIAAIMALSQADGHVYDMGNGGWDYLRHDMGNGGCEVDEDELRDFVGALVECGLVDVGMWRESQKITMRRLIKEAEEGAKSRAKTRARIDAMNSARRGK